MSIVNNSNFNMPSLNGLVDINADSVSSTSIASDEISSKNVDTQTLYVNGVDLGTQVNLNAQKLTGITYTATPTPTTNISNKLIVSSIDATNTSVFRSNINVLGTGTIFRTMQVDEDININGRLSSFGSTNTMDGSLNIKGVLDVSRNSIFRNNLDVSANLYVGKNNPNDTSTIDVTGQMIIRNPSNPTITYMRIFYLPAGAGFRFINEQPSGYIYFSVKNNVGTIRNISFNFGQYYSNVPSYFDTEMNVSYNNQFTFGDTNFTGTWFGVSQKYIPNTAVTSGFVTYNKGLMNNATYYSNWIHVNTSNVDVPTMRMSWEGIWSKVPHTMESTLSVAGNLTLTGNLIANSTTITPVQLSYLNGTSSNIQTQLNNKLDLTGGTISGNLTISGTTTLNAQVNLNDTLYVNSTNITPTQISYLAGATSNIQSQLNGKLNSLGTTLSGSLTFADATIQSTAYTTADDTKLQAIGEITTATVAGNTNLVTGAIFSAGSMTLTAGTYLITINAYLNVITGTTTINGMAAAFSTSATAFTQAIGAQQDGGGFIWPVASGWSLNSTNPVVVTSTTTYHMLIRATFSVAGRLRFLSGNSAFTATRIG